MGKSLRSFFLVLWDNINSTFRLFVFLYIMRKYMHNFHFFSLPWENMHVVTFFFSCHEEIWPSSFYLCLFRGRMFITFFTFFVMRKSICFLVSYFLCHGRLYVRWFSLVRLRHVRYVNLALFFAMKSVCVFFTFLLFFISVYFVNLFIYLSMRLLFFSFFNKTCALPLSCLFLFLSVE